VAASEILFVVYKDEEVVGAVSEVALAFQICENCCLEEVVVVEVPL